MSLCMVSSLETSIRSSDAPRASGNGAVVEVLRLIDPREVMLGDVMAIQVSLLSSPEVAGTDLALQRSLMLLDVFA
jgi:hypothetical protein